VTAAAAMSLQPLRLGDTAPPPIVARLPADEPDSSQEMLIAGPRALDGGLLAAGRVCADAVGAGRCGAAVCGGWRGCCFSDQLAALFSAAVFASRRSRSKSSMILWIEPLVDQLACIVQSACRFSSECWGRSWPAFLVR